MQLNKIGLSAVIAIALAFAGCSSGGSDGDDSTTYSASGAVAKGIIIGGQVTARELVDGDWVERGSAITDESGAYTLDMENYQGGIVVLSVASLPTTEMIDDDPSSSTFGQSIAADPNLEMDSVIGSVGSGTVSNVPITPYTHMAAAIVGKTLEAGSPVTDDVVDNANSEVSVLVGFDVINTAVVDVTNADAMANASAFEQQAAMLCAAVTMMVDESTSLADVVDLLADSFEDGIFSSTDGILISDLTDAWSAIASNTAFDDLVDDTVILQIENKTAAINTAVAASGDGSYNPEPSGNAGDPDIVIAKAVMSDMRSLVNNMLETDYDTPLDLVADEAGDVVDLFDRDMAAIAEFTELGIQTMLEELSLSNDVYLEELELNSTTAVQVEVYDELVYLGDLTLSVTDPVAGAQIVLSGTLTGSGEDAASVVYNDLTLSTNVPLEDFLNLMTDQTTYSLEVSGSVSSADSSIGMTDGTVTVVAEEPVSEGVEPSFSSISLSDMTLVLDSDGGTFTGTAGFSFVAVDEASVSAPLYGDIAFLTLSSVDLSGDFALDSGAEFAASVSLDLSNSDTFDIAAFLNQHNVVYVWMYDVLSQTEIDNLVATGLLANDYWELDYGHYWNSTFAWTYDDVNGWLEADGSYASFAAVVDPEAALAEAMTSTSEYDVWWIDLWASSTGESELEAEIELGSLDETENSFLQLEFTLSTALTGISGMPNIEVTATVVRSALNAGSAVVQLNWDDDLYVMTLAVDDFDNEIASLTITNPDNASLILTNIDDDESMDELTGELLVGDSKIADIETLDNGLVKITYIDETIEIF
ncbi:hypothetical protein [Reinekea marinisedimentorum]|uniref:Uncharacterized protein n=1 Tax=Reinekea marinisedimentorum TaxID=230495 RepID=A0A4R3I6U8_9GAMM|nr:hypothetical protein [Reinekea marinisedimentorum]TCS41413.1 hypothetical protein BCF53_106144 [Reinekea marinisedimentorum]